MSRPHGTWQAILWIPVSDNFMLTKADGLLEADKCSSRSWHGHGIILLEFFKPWVKVWVNYWIEHSAKKKKQIASRKRKKVSSSKNFCTLQKWRQVGASMSIQVFLGRLQNGQAEWVSSCQTCQKWMGWVNGWRFFVSHWVAFDLAKPSTLVAAMTFPESPAPNRSPNDFGLETPQEPWT